MNNEYSKWALLDRMYEAKRSYYGDGKSSLTDQEYDALERSIIAIHGEQLLKDWYCVGYDSDTHNKIKENLNAITKKYIRLTDTEC